MFTPLDLFSQVKLQFFYPAFPTNSQTVEWAELDQSKQSVLQELYQPMKQICSLLLLGGCSFRLVLVIDHIAVCHWSEW